MAWAWFVVLGVLVAMNGWATWRVLQDATLPASRRRAQIALVWLLPAIGAVVCLAFVSATSGREDTLDRTAFVDNAAAWDVGTAEAMPSAGADAGGGDAGGGDGGCGD